MNETARVWDAATGKPVTSPGAATTVATAPNGTPRSAVFVTGPLQAAIPRVGSAGPHGVRSFVCAFCITSPGLLVSI